MQGWESVLGTDGTVAVGGVMVGLVAEAAETTSHSQEPDMDRIWIAAAVTHNGLDAFVSKGELEGIADQLRDVDNN